MPIPAADGDFFPIFFYCAFRPSNAFPTYSERLASQDLQAAEIFEPKKSAGGARARSNAVSRRRRRISSMTMLTRAHRRCGWPARVYATAAALHGCDRRGPPRPVLGQARRDICDRRGPPRPVLGGGAPRSIQHKSPSPSGLNRFFKVSDTLIFFISLTMVLPYI